MADAEDTDRIAPPGSIGRIEPCPILLVEDDASARDFLAEALRLHGHEVDAVGSCLQAREKLASGLYSSILLDVVLPDTSGIFLYYGIKARWPDLVSRVIFMTGAIERHPHLGVLRQAERPVLLKPIRFSEVLQAIREVSGGISQTRRTRSLTSNEPG